MRTKMLTTGLLLSFILILSGCQTAIKPERDGTAEVSTLSFSESAEETVGQTEKSEPTVTVLTEAPESISEEETGNEESVAEVANTEETVVVLEEAEANVGQNDTVSESEPEIIEQPEQPQSKEDNPPANESKPAETMPPVPDEPEVTQEPEPDFDINYWIDFAAGYSESIGLVLDCTATECWDNPITANPSRTNLKDDIISRLNRYRNVEGFTAVWIWAEKISDTEYELYIGYA